MNVINFTNNHKNIFLKNIGKIRRHENSKFNSIDLILRIF